MALPMRLERLIDRSLRRWQCLLRTRLDVKSGPRLLWTSVALFITVVQIIYLMTISSKDAYCTLPYLRARCVCDKSIIDGYLPIIYLVTPTYSRHVQKAELTRLSHTMMLAPNVHWIIVEDSFKRTTLVKEFVSRLKTHYGFRTISHLNAATPQSFKLKSGEPSWKKPKGVWQRNKALSWLRDNHNALEQEGIVYFADDDNTYDLELFDNIRDTKKISVWPVAFAGGLLVEKPIIDQVSGKVSGFNSMWRKERPFPFDMAGFAVSLKEIIKRPDAIFSEHQQIGYVESHFLKQFVGDWTELEPRASNCTKILVWHTRTSEPALHEERRLSQRSDLGLT